MQAQQYAVVHDYYNNGPHPMSSPSHSIPDPYLAASDAAQNFEIGFSRGSSFPYPHQDYRYMLDRGELTPRLCGISLVDHTFDATGLGFTGNPSSSSGSTFAAPEDIPAYQPLAWDWSGDSPSDRIVAPAPVYAAPPEPTYLGDKSAPRGGTHPSCIPSLPAQLPTPAAMAILLNPHGRSDGEPTQNGYEVPPGPALVASLASAEERPIVRPVPPAGAPQASREALSREKKHGCTMCHKGFDRPSTLKKHLLVHTGEKAFVCQTCSRRFGVASNLNRHVKRCVLKTVNTPSPSNKSSTSSGSPSSMTMPDSPEASTQPSTSPTEGTSASAAGIRLGKRIRAPSIQFTDASGSSPSSSASSSHSAANANASPTNNSKPPGQKRRRRAPSPSQWVPETLQNFNLLSDDSYRVTNVPLPPVRRNPPKEERDSWDENVGHAPYHPCGWSGVLPGPGLGHGLGLGGKDVRNLNLGGRGGFMLGRVLVF